MLDTAAVVAPAEGRRFVGVPARAAQFDPSGPAAEKTISALGIGLIALIVFSAAGPPGTRTGPPGPARRRTLFSSAGSTAAAASTAQSPSLTAPFNARLSGSLKQRASAGSGLTSVQMRMNMSRGASGTLDVTITGQPVQGGGVAMTQGSVSLGPNGEPTLTRAAWWTPGWQIVASAQSSDGLAMRLAVDASIDQASGGVSGTPRRGGARMPEGTRRRRKQPPQFPGCWPAYGEGPDHP